MNKLLIALAATLTLTGCDTKEEAAMRTECIEHLEAYSGVVIRTLESAEYGFLKDMPGQQQHIAFWKGTPGKADYTAYGGCVFKGGAITDVQFRDRNVNLQ